jgi:Zn-dependent peptidase ImmA (M78 family)
LRFEIRRAYQQGSQQAQRELRRLALDLSQRVEIFDVIERSGVWLMFQPLDKLFGFYERTGDTAGIVVHAGHPLTLQRFTGAHEYGHHVLGHERSLDLEHDIDAEPDELPAQEAAAQGFAANFLMPLQLVNRTLRRVGLPREPQSVSSEQVYELSLLLGTSYQATISQLQALHKIHWRHARELRKQKPIDIKTRLAGGRRPENARADMWRVDEQYDGEQIVVRVEDEIHVALAENPTTGARWLPRGRTEAITLIDSWPEPDAGEQVYGRPRFRHFWFRADEPGSAALSLALARPQNQRRIARTFELEIAIARRRTGESDHGLSEHQRVLLAA